MATTYDAIVIGAGQNGLTCACYLARAGLSVLILEQYRTVGGMTISEELTLPGFQSDVHATGYQLANISPVPAELDLATHGVELVEPERVYAHAFPDGRAILVERDLDRTITALESWSRRDAAACRRLFELFGREQANLVQSMFSAPPSFAETALALASTPGGMARERFSLQSIRSWVNETFETEAVRSLFGAFGLFVGSAPDDAGGAEIAWLFGSLLQQTGNNLVRGGMHQVTLALARVLAEHGGEIRTDATVDRILVDEDRASGVQLATGEKIGARQVVVSCADPGQLVHRFLRAEVVGKEIADAMATYEWGDATMVMYVALDRPVEYTAGLELRQAAHVHLSPPSIGAMAEATNQCRVGQLPNAPLVVAWNESTIDSSRAPDGKALMKFVVLGAPWKISGDATGKIAARDWDAAKEPYAAHLLESIERDYLPGLRRHILKCVAHSPVDLNRKLSSAVRGTIGHGAMLPYQKGSMRPVPGLGQYRTPVPNVYLGDSGCHPGAGVSMAPGHNAAKTILSDLQLG